MPFFALIVDDKGELLRLCKIAIYHLHKYS
ncbi:MAG: hypothetical protein H6Q69_3190, partial [Firmicutes bacterium]|nr:hypothetical protein [Bacillota bacterium]